MKINSHIPRMNIKFNYIIEIQKLSKLYTHETSMIR